jgi:nucleotide-binding universal stress UspA family protein
MIMILLPTDFSDSATNAAEYALGLFGHKDVTFVLVHAFVEPNNSADMLVSLNDILQKQAQEDMAKAYNELVSKFPEAAKSISTRMEHGTLTQVLRSITATEKVDYVVMGTVGASGIKKVFFGSNASSVAKKVKCPLIMVPDKVRYRPLTTIAFATDYDGLGDSKTLQPLSTLAKKCNSQLLMVNVKKNPAATTIEYETGGMSLGHLFEGLAQRFYTLGHPDIIEGIKHFTDKHGADMLAMVAKEHNTWEKLFVHSLTKEMVIVGEIPVLIMHEAGG